MPRFLKGTLDHDNDGKMGGSRKETDVSKAPTKKPKSSAHTAKTGMEPGADAETAKKAAKAQFAEADAKAQPDQAHEDLQVQRSVRGW